MYIPRLSSALFLILGIIISTLGFHFYDGYYEAKQQGVDVSYPAYVKQRLDEIGTGLKQVPDIAAEAHRSSDDIVMGSMQKIEQALLMYNLNTNEYPADIEELLGDYLSPDNKIITQESFTYRRTAQGGYAMSIVLPVSGKKYIVSE